MRLKVCSLLLIMLSIMLGNECFAASNNDLVAINPQDVTVEVKAPSYAKAFMDSTASGIWFHMKNGATFRVERASAPYLVKNKQKDLEQLLKKGNVLVLQKRGDGTFDVYPTNLQASAPSTGGNALTECRSELQELKTNLSQAQTGQSTNEMKRNIEAVIYRLDAEQKSIGSASAN